MKNIVLYFGSFNPIHNGHTSVAGYVALSGLCDEVWFVVSPQNPFKEGSELVSAADRLAMVNIAIKEVLPGLPVLASDVELYLPSPSYTIDTLRFLSRKYPESSFSILIGTDVLDRLPQWKEYNELMSNYRFLVYPREGYAAINLLDNMIFLADAPTFRFSSTDVREAIISGRYAGNMVSRGVLQYIKSNGLWPVESDHQQTIDSLTERLTQGDNAALYLERGKEYYRTGRFNDALNDFLKALELEPSNHQAQAYEKMVREIFDFRYMDYYNP